MPLCDCCHVDRPAEMFRPYPSRATLHTTCNRCHAAQQRARRGGLKQLTLILPDDLRGLVTDLLDKTGETPGELVERLVRQEITRGTPHV